MRNLMIIIIIFMSACGIHKQQNNNLDNIALRRYKPLSKFDGDTLAFVQHSILDRKQYYIGKELGVFLKDLDIPIVEFSFYPAPINIFKVYDTILDIRSLDEEEQKLKNNEDPIVFSIRWDPPLNANALDSLRKGRPSGEWTPEIQQYLREQIVGDIVKTDFKLKK